MQLFGKTVLITGGASGLGAATARRLVAAGARVVLADLNEQAAQPLVRDLGANAVFVKTNVADPQSAQAAVDLAWSKFGSLDGLVNCAGIGIPEKVVDKDGNPQSLEHFAKVINVNLVGTFNMIRLVAASIAKRISAEELQAGPVAEHGVVVSTASVAAFEGQIGQAAYSASKGGIVALTLPLAREFSRFGIRVMTIAPGIFDTPMLAGLPEKARQSLGSQVPFPSRLGNPEEFGALVQQIFENQMLNGEVIRLDGAMRMAAR